MRLVTKMVLIVLRSLLVLATYFVLCLYCGQLLFCCCRLSLTRVLLLMTPALCFVNLNAAQVKCIFQTFVYIISI